jgi:enoyl-CoA hydratase/carnithine racemase
MSDRVTFTAGDDHVGVVSLSRPDKLNAMDVAMFDGLHDAAAQARDAIAEGAVRAVLLRAEGRAFSAGLDVSLFQSQLAAVGAAPLHQRRPSDTGSAGGSSSPEAPSPDEWIAHLQQAFTGLEDLPVPVVAAVQGLALGGGCQLALAAHLRLASPDAELALLEARWGIIPDLGGLTRLPRLVGQSRAIDMAVTARRIDAATALAWGLVDQVVEDDLDGVARAYAARLAAGPTLALGAIPRLVRQAAVLDRDASLAAERAHQPTCLGSADFAEAATAAVEGREPRFRGR